MHKNLVIFLLILCCCKTVYSQTQQQRQQAQQAFEKGVELYNQKNYTSALTHFQNAYDLTNNWRVLFNIGQTFKKLNKNSNAFHVLQNYLTLGSDQIDVARREEVEALIQEIRNATGILRVYVNIVGAKITVDNTEQGISPIGQIILDRGRHTVEVSKQGYVAVERQIEITGIELNLNIELNEQEIAVVENNQNESIQQPESISEPFYKKWWFWTVVGVVVVGAGVGIGIGAGTSSSETQYEFNGIEIGTE